MKMSKENYEKFKKWFDYTVENASDDVITYIFECLAFASKIAMENIDKAKKAGVKAPTKDGKN